jgi:phospholipid/cholesterol/gamma-HCH transport system ATP-binding protein
MAEPAGDENVAQKSEVYQIRIRGIEKAFGDHKVLRGVNLDIERGRIHIIIGGSGQGKSVLMKHLMGLLKPDKGHIYVDGEDVVPLDDFELNRVRRKFGMLFQYAALFDSFTVEQNVAFPLVEHTKKSKAEIRDLVVSRLQSLGLRNIEKKYPAELSGGMRKRVGLARALVLEPQILLYDEPTTGLDPVATKNVDDMIRDISAETGVTSVVISHDMASTFRIAHRISMLYEGKIAVSGTPDDIKKSTLPFVREFVEMSGTVTFDKPPPAAEPGSDPGDPQDPGDDEDTKEKS